MDEYDKDDFVDLLKNASDSQLINLCEYEIRLAKSCESEEDRNTHFEFADLTYTEMEERKIV